MKLKLDILTLSFILCAYITGGYGSALKSTKQSVAGGTQETSLKPVESAAETTGGSVNNPGDDLLAMESETDQVAIQSNIAAAAVHYHYNNLPKDEQTKPQTYYYDHVPDQIVQPTKQQNSQAELHEGNKYPLHSDVVAAGTVQKKNKHKPKYQQQHEQYDYLDFKLPFSHNEVVNLLVEVFGAAIIPLLLLPLIGIALLYLIWYETQKRGPKHFESSGPVEEYYFDNGVTYGKGKHSYVVGYDYGSSVGGHRKLNELTRRVLPHLDTYDNDKRKYRH